MRLLLRLLAWWVPWRPSLWPRARAKPSATHAKAAAEQAELLAELDLLQLAMALQQRAQKQGGYQGEGLDLMLSIADLLERNHGWDLEHSDAWLERMGVWDGED